MCPPSSRGDHYPRGGTNRPSGPPHRGHAVSVVHLTAVQSRPLSALCPSCTWRNIGSSEYHTIIPQISVGLSVCHSISTETVRTVYFALGQCVARNPTMCLFFLSLYGCGQVIQLNDFASCSLAFVANVVVMLTVSQERVIPQLIACELPFNQKLHRLSKTVH